MKFKTEQVQKLADIIIKSRGRLTPQEKAELNYYDSEIANQLEIIEKNMSIIGKIRLWCSKKGKRKSKVQK